MKLRIYLITTFGITWVCWWALAWLVSPGGSPMASSGNLVLYLLGGFGPTIGTAVAVAAMARAGYSGTFVQDLLRWRVGVFWWLAALAAPVLLAAGKEWIAVGASGMFNGVITASALEPPVAALTIFPTMIIGGGLEELGWRGLAQPEIEGRAPQLAVPLLVGVMWALWHLPLFYIHGVAQFGGNFPIFAADILANAYLLGWLYAATRSIPVCVVGHAASNSATAMGFLALVSDPTEFHAMAAIWIGVLVKLAVAVALFASLSANKNPGTHRVA